MRYFADLPGWGWDNENLKWIKMNQKQAIRAETSEAPTTASTPEREPATYRELLFRTWRNCRGWPGWEVIKSCHEPEDVDYFEMLDNLGGSK